jgi:adenine specific DNA methylase Mod
MNSLYYGDNLTVLRNEIKDESIDLVYLDPPFNSQATYNVLFKSTSGEKSKAQIEAFEDTWQWEGGEAEKAFDEVMHSQNTNVAEMLRAMRPFLDESDVMAYLCMMAVRLLELHRVLKPSGSIYLHCDPTASHYLKILMDAIFGAANFKNEIIWKRTSAHSSAKRYGPVHDVILFYGVSDSMNWIGGHQAYEENYIKQRFARGEDRPWKDADLTGSGVRHGETGEVWRGFDITAKDDIGRIRHQN